ncbi:MAG TPA: hypothetical protein VFG30_08675, partial [Polyangiales bacterium]|nr:hypothetical protein [Polyangiales bacterium]
MSKAKRDKEKKRRQKERARLNRKARESRAAALVSDVPKTGWEVTYWVVAFLDLMGYSNVLNGLDEFGPSRDGIDQEKYAAAYGRAHKIRKRFHAFLKPKPQDVTGELPWVDGIPESVKRLVLHSRRMRVIEAPGADHMVLILSMSPEVDHYPWRAFVAMLTTVSIAMIVQLAIGDEEPDNGLPVRGGIDVAPGSRIG